MGQDTTKNIWINAILKPWGPKGQTGLAFLILVLVLVASAMIAFFARGIQPSGCTHPESSSTSPRADMLATLQLALVVGLVGGLLYGPVHWTLLSVVFCIAHITFSIIHVGLYNDKAGNEALLFITSVAPGIVGALHYTAAYTTQKSFLRIFGTIVFAFILAQLILSTLNVPTSWASLTAALCEMVALACLTLSIRV